MPKYYLLGGENTLRRDAREINQIAFNEAGEKPNVLVFPWARASFDNTYTKRKLISDYFRSLGAYTVNFADYSFTNQELKERISDADLIYLTGGVPSVLLERLRKQDNHVLLEKFKGIIVGRSAGALVLCKKCVVTYRRTSSVKLICGLGFVDITLKAHYKLRNSEKLKELSVSNPIFALPKGSALVFDNGKLCALGKAYLFNKGQQQIFVSCNL